jgi:pSer/pThr/pTyr-binding forkhead associated (FHA) protein
MPPTLLRPSTDAETERLDALPRMSHAARRRTIPDTAAEPGRYLVAEDGGERRLLRLGTGTVHIGRGFGADLRLDDPAVSRRHAIIVCDDAGALVLDDRSANGTRVNGRCVTGAQLADGDVILVGRVVLTYREFG